MATFTAVFEDEGPAADRVAWQARIIVQRDGEYFQFVAIGVSGEGLAAIDASEPPHGLLSSLARISQAWVRAAIDDRQIPLATPTDPFEVLLDDPQVVRTCMAALTPPFSRGAVAWTYDE